MMNEADFWDLIEQSRSKESQVNYLRSVLGSINDEAVVGFELQLRRQRVRAHTRQMAIANYIIRGYISDDEFEEFRTWLVCQGKSRFEMALEDVESIAEWLDPHAVPDMNGVALLLVASDIAADEDHFYEMLYGSSEYIEDPFDDFQVPADEIILKSELPRVFAKYWDPEKVIGIDKILKARDDLTEERNKS